MIRLDQDHLWGRTQFMVRPIEADRHGHLPGDEAFNPPPAEAATSIGADDEDAQRNYDNPRFDGTGMVRVAIAALALWALLALAGLLCNYTL